VKEPGGGGFGKLGMEALGYMDRRFGRGSGFLGEREIPSMEYIGL